MFEELKVRVRLNKFATLSNIEAHAVFEVLDELVKFLEGHADEECEECHVDHWCRDILDKAEFVSNQSNFIV